MLVLVDPSWTLLFGWGPPEVPDGSVEERRVVLVELLMFLGLINCTKKVLFHKNYCQTSGSVSGT